MLDVHLMIERPERQVADFVAPAPTRSPFTPRRPRMPPTPRTRFARAGRGVGVAINPATPVEALAELAGTIDLALCMTVSPGWGGQPFIARSPLKIARLRALLGGEGSSAALEVDGGIDPTTTPVCREAGTTLFVAGSAIFHASDPGAAYRAIAESIDAI